MLNSCEYLTFSQRQSWKNFLDQDLSFTDFHSLMSRSSHFSVAALILLENPLELLSLSETSLPSPNTHIEQQPHKFQIIGPEKLLSKFCFLSHLTRSQ